MQPCRAQQLGLFALRIQHLEQFFDDIHRVHRGVVGTFVGLLISAHHGLVLYRRDCAELRIRLQLLPDGFLVD